MQQQQKKPALETLGAIPDLLIKKIFIWILKKNNFIFLVILQPTKSFLHPTILFQSEYLFLNFATKAGFWDIRGNLRPIKKNI